jgi:hypothetical protein
MAQQVDSTAVAVVVVAQQPIALETLVLEETELLASQL